MAGLTAQWFMDRAATRIGDPGKTRVKAPELLDAVNLALNDLCTTFDIFEYEDDFDLPADRELSYPVECTRFTRIEASATPSDPDSFRKVDEKMVDEFDDFVGRGAYPVSEVPEFYLAAQGSIKIAPKPSAEVVGGGFIRYFGVPEVITDANTIVPLPNFLKSYLLERVIIYALESDERMQEAAALETKWRAREEGIRNLIEDRSDDRRSALRPQASKEGHRGMA